MNRKLGRSLVYRTIFLMIAIVALYFFLVQGFLLNSIGGSAISVSFMFYPLLACFLILYSRMVFDVLLEGRFAEKLSEGIDILALGSLFSLMLMTMPFHEEVHLPGFWLLMSVFALAFGRMAGVIARTRRSSFPEILVMCATFMVAGYTLMNLADSLPSSSLPIPPASLGEIVLGSFILVSAVSLLGVFADSNSPLLSAVGDVATRPKGLTAAFLVGLLLTSYFFSWRWTLLSSLGPYLVLVEWGVVCFAALVIYAFLEFHVTRTLAEELQLGNWRALVQKVTLQRGEIDEVTKIVERFVDEGYKQELLVFLVSMLVENGLPSGQVEAVVGELADYFDIPEPKFVFSWRVERLEKENRIRRLKVLKDTLEEAAELSGLAGSRAAVEEKLEVEVA